MITKGQRQSGSLPKGKRQKDFVVELFDNKKRKTHSQQRKRRLEKTREKRLLGERGLLQGREKVRESNLITIFVW